MTMKMTRRLVRMFVVVFLVGGLALSQGPSVLAQMGPGRMGPGMMGRQGARDQGQGAMPMPQMADVMKQMVDRLGTRKPLAPDRAEELRRLAEQLRAAAAQMGEGMGGMMGGGMMGQASQQMAEMNRILSRMSQLLRDE